MKAAWNFRNFDYLTFRLLNLSSERARNAFVGDRIPRSTWIPFPWLFALYHLRSFPRAYCRKNCSRLTDGFNSKGEMYVKKNDAFGNYRGTSDWLRGIAVTRRWTAPRSHCSSYSRAMIRTF